MLKDCILRLWLPSIGDPDFIDWVITFGYFIVGFFALRVHRVIGSISDIKEPHVAERYWIILTVVLIILGINKQLDLHHLFTITAKCVSWSEGWYKQRKIIQLAFIAILFVFGVGIMAVTIHYFRKRGRSFYLSILGVGILICFILLRANSFHQVDAFFRVHVLGARITWILEIGGQALILWNAVLLLREARRSR